MTPLLRLRLALGLTIEGMAFVLGLSAPTLRRQEEDELFGAVGHAYMLIASVPGLQDWDAQNTGASYPNGQALALVLASHNPGEAVDQRRSLMAELSRWRGAMVPGYLALPGETVETTTCDATILSWEKSGRGGVAVTDKGPIKAEEIRYIK